VRRRLLIALTALTLLAGAGPAAAVETRASLPDIEDEVMCTVCGTTLQLSDSPQAEQERDFINGLIAAGRDKDQIKAALVDEYGSEVLAVPEASGFGLAAFLIPIAGVAIALAAVGLAARRWRRARRAEQDRPAAGATPSAADEERLTAALRRYEL
jgi:cytochrome c-type biogenesis protein CcmH